MNELSDVFFPPVYSICLELNLITSHKILLIPRKNTRRLNIPGILPPGLIPRAVSPEEYDTAVKAKHRGLPLEHDPRCEGGLHIIYKTLFSLCFLSSLSHDKCTSVCVHVILNSPMLTALLFRL